MQYEQLDDRSGIDHIRILRLAPSQNVSDPIHMRLSNVNLADEPTYEALSYCWGDATKRLPVICNGNQFHVTENLDSALRHLRLETEERTLWVDAICIDQTNISERSFQVSLMQRIYRLAERVVVWLGDGEADSNLVFPLCEKMFEERSDALKDFWANTDILLGPDRESFMKQKLIEAKRRAKAEDDESQENDNSDSVKPNSQDSKRDDNIAVDEEIDVSDPSDEEISAFLQLLARPWFYRSWIVQEVSLAQEALILCGTNSIDWNVFAMGFMHAVCLSSKGPRGRPVQIHRSALLLIAILRVKLLDSDDTYYSDLNILWILRMVLPLNATDPRDKVYAILGLLSDEEAQQLRLAPDYTLSAEECYQKATLAIMSQMKNLDILITDRLPESGLKLPSWVANWSVLPFPAPTYLDPNLDERSGVETTRPSFCASLSTQWLPKVSNDGKILTLSGYDFDEITELESILTVPAYDYTDIASVSNFFSFMKKMALELGSYFDTLVKWDRLAISSKYAQYPTGEDSETAFAMTMSTGTIELPEVALQKFKKWRKALRGPRAMGFLGGLGITGWIYKSVICAAGTVSAATQDDRSYSSATEATLYRCLARTKKGYLAVVPSQTVVGDRVALYKGGRLPFTVRLGQNDDRREIMGPCYVHGMMYGEAWDEMLCRDFEII